MFELLHALFYACVNGESLITQLSAQTRKLTIICEICV